MDEQRRRLERLVASGDPSAEEALHHHYIRLGLVPDSDLGMMGCGFVGGYGDETVAAALGMWQKLLVHLFERSSSNLDDYFYEAGEEPGYQDPGLKLLKNMVEKFIAGEASLEDLNSSLDNTHYWLDPYLEGYLQGLPLYLHHNDVTGSLRFAYVEELEGEESFKLDITLREGKMGSQTYSTLMHWAIPEYVPFEGTAFPSILKLPIWNTWGYAPCNRHPDIISDPYEPLVFDGMVWLK